MALKVGKASAKAFFDEVCPLFLRLHHERSRALGGRIAVCLSGASGGAWTVDLDAACISPGASAADVTLYTSAGELEAMLAGKTNATAAFADGRMRCEGDANVLARFAALLSAGAPAPVLEKEFSS